jgi:hypothetical protein
LKIKGPRVVDGQLETLRWMTGSMKTPQHPKRSFEKARQKNTTNRKRHSDITDTGRKMNGWQTIG